MLQECLRSLLASEGVELQVVVVANHCKEELPPIIEESADIHLWVTPRNLGFSEANNAGVAWARKHLGEADYYYFINNDTCSSPDALRRLVEACEAEPDIGATGPQLRIWGAPDHLNSLGLNVTDDAWGWDEGIGIALADYGDIPPQREVAALTGSALLMEAEVFRQVGGWTEIYQYYFEDIDLCLKTWKRGKRVVHVPEAIVLHQISATMSVGSEWKLFLFWRNRLLLALIHWPGDLLRALAKRVWVDEIWRRPRAENGMQRRALRGALVRLPGLLACRWRFRGDDAWRRFLVPAGSGPVITLPETRDPFAEDEAAPDVAAPDVAASEGSEAHWQAARDLHRAHSDVTIPRRADGDPPRRVLVLGWGPLPFESTRMNYAPGARSWQLAQPLAAAGHSVCLVVAAMPGAYGDDDVMDASSTHDGVLIYRLHGEAFDDGPALPELLDAFDPEVVVGAAAQPSRRAAQLAGERALWVDLFGDPMAEAQAKAGVHGEGDHLTAYWRMTADLLDRGDAFGAVSQRQAWAAVGQLGLAGRLNRQTHGETLVHTVPCVVPALMGGGAEDSPSADLPDAVAALPESAHVVLWSGGFNTWCDIDTLAKALDAAMALRPNMHFVATGGRIDGQDEGTFDSLRRQLEASPHKDRCHLLGCLPAPQAMACLKRADVAVVTERSVYERQLGSSGRLSNWLAHGVPFICTELSELAEELASHDFAQLYPPGDAVALSSLLVASVDHREAWRRQAEAAANWAAERFSATATTAPLKRFVAAARRAPDAKRQAHRYLAAGEDVVLQAERDAAQAQLAEQTARAERFETQYHAVRGELGKVHQSRMWKLWMAYLAPRQWLKSLLNR